jgi:RNA polymerase sigma factor (sigma-70 family)
MSTGARRKLSSVATARLEQPERAGQHGTRRWAVERSNGGAPGAPGTCSGSPGNTRIVRYRGQPEQTDAQQIESSFTDPEAFTVLFERHAVPLYRYIVKRVGRSDAPDVLGETFATGFRSRRAYDLDRSDARPWLFGIATNCVRRLWRSEQRRLTREAAAAVRDIAEDHSEEALSTVFFHGQSQPIAEALEHLDDTSLDVLLLVAGPGFTYEQISIALDIPVGTVRSRLSRARRKLRELLGEPGQYLDEGPRVERATNASEGSQ